MFKLQRQSRFSTSGERVDFKFSNFQALQVPKGWDRLFLSMISVETGKTVAKLGKSIVRNGSCVWTETLLESVWISKDDSSSKELKEFHYKFVVSMGSSRAGILGEAIIDMSSYKSSKTSPVSLPLRKCNHGTILQVKIHCLTPRPDLRQENTNPSSYHARDHAIDYQDTDHKPNTSDDSYANGVKASANQDLAVTSNQGKYDSEESSRSESSSSHISNPVEGYKRGEHLNSSDHLNSKSYIPHRRHVGGSPRSSPSQDEYPPENHSLSSLPSCNSGLINSRMNLQSGGNESGAASPINIGSKDLLEAAEGTIDELRAEAKMWERNARKLMLDLDMLRDEFLDQSKKQADLVMELSATYAEQDGLRKEVEQLKLSLEESTEKQREIEDSTYQSEGLTHIQKELEGEIKYQQESNANLALQLRRSQESNIKLVSVLQELEETIEQQRVEIENLSQLQLKYNEIESSTEQIREIESLKEKVEELERDCVELTDENLELLLKLKESKNGSIENVGSFSSASSDFPTKSASAQSEVSDVEPQIYDIDLKKNVMEEQWTANETSELFLELLKQVEVGLQCLMKPVFGNSSVVTEKYKYLHENLVNFTKKDMPNSKLWTESIPKYFFELNNLLDDRMAEFEEIFKHDELEIQKKNAVIAESEKNLKDQILKIQEHERAKAELEAGYANLLTELSEKRSEIEKLEAYLLRKEVETNSCIQHQRELEVLIADLEIRKFQLEENYKTVQRENSVNSKCMDDLRSDLDVLSCSLNSHVSAKEIHERKVSELETEKVRLEDKIAELEEENLQFQECMSILDIQMRKFKEETEIYELELKNSESAATNLQVQIGNLEIEMETQTSNLKQEVHDTKNQLLEAQIDCECLRKENQDLHTSSLVLGEECKILQRLNKELKKKEIELHEHCAQLEAQLKESEKSFSACSKKIEALQENLASMLGTFSLKETNLHLELDALLQENRLEKEKLNRQEALWNEMHSEMSANLRNLQEEVECLTRQISVVHEEKKKIESEASSQISSLLSDKTKLESNLQEVYRKVESSEVELNTVREESRLEVQRLTSEVAASEQSQVLLRSEQKKLLKQQASYEKTEDKLKTALNDIELKLTISDYENQQLREENANMKIQYQRIGDLEDEVSILKRNIEQCRSEKENLEASLRTICGENDALKAEKISCCERIVILQEELSKYESSKKKRMAIEEKLLQMEDALLTKKALHVQKVNLENELSEVKKANEQYQKKILRLEEAQAACLDKAQALEVQLKLMEEKCKCGRKEGNSSTAKLKNKSKHQRVEALDMDNVDKIELQSFSSEEQSSQRFNLKKSITDSPVVPKERYERTKSSLEAELRELRERYFHMSLRFAEVEAQREDLVMKLKAIKTGKRWFS